MASKTDVVQDDTISAHLTVACVQFCADNNLSRNIEEATHWARAAAARGAQLICLPENFAYLEADDRRSMLGAFPEEEHPALAHFQQLARTIHCWMLLGSLTIRLPDGKVNNRCYVLDSNGLVVAHYNKLHLFDVDLRAGERYHESSTVSPGDQAAVVTTPWGALGLSICYDLRFAYLYRMLARAGAVFLTIPAAFTRTTGQAHWHVLVRARAIETGCFVFAPGQCGVRATGRATYGHSLIVDPWGKVVAECEDEPGVIIAEIDPGLVQETRRLIPSLQHDRPVSAVKRFG